MTTFEVHTVETAPEESKPILQGARKSMGFVPNLYGALAESPALLEAYATIGNLFDKETGFDATERQIVLLTASVLNECRYCVAAHSAMAKMQKIPDGVIDELREGKRLSNPKLEALRGFARKVVEKRGWVSGDDIQEFLAAGYSNRHVLEVVLGVGMKTLSNYANHIAETPLDEVFRPELWKILGGAGSGS